MARRRIGAHWLARIAVLAENENLSAEAIGRRLLIEATPDDRPPVGRTIQRYLREHRARPLEEKLSFRYFSWPESMESGALPWEASKTALELLRFRREELLFTSRPTNEEMRWFWRVTQAGPDAAIMERLEMAMKLYDHHTDYPAEDPETNRKVEWCLSFAPWRSRKHAATYVRATRDKRNPLPPFVGFEKPVIPPMITKGRPKWQLGLLRDQTQPKKRDGIKSPGKGGKQR